MEPLKPDTCYHIFNHANGFEHVFREPENYRYFLEKYCLYISPIVETYAYCLMPNHFHLVVRIRKREAIEELIRNKNNNNNSSNNNFSKVVNFGKVSSSISSMKSIGDSEIEKYLSKQFANLFSCYTQSFNKVYHRMGSLFIKNFKREPILDKSYFLNAVIYTHRNPIHHGFRKDYDEWEYSSYNEIIEGRSEKVVVNKLLNIFGGLESFIEIHHQSLPKYRKLDELEIP